MKARKTAAILLALMLCTSLVCVSAAASWLGDSSSPGMQIQWTNTSDFAVDLRFSGTTAYLSTSIIGESGTSKITATMTLYKYINGAWQYLASWSGSSNSASLGMANSWTVARGYNYKLTVAAGVTRSGSTENLSKSVEAYCP